MRLHDHIVAFTGKEKERSQLASQLEKLATRSKEIQDRYEAYVQPSLNEAVRSGAGSRTNPIFPRREPRQGAHPNASEQSASALATGPGASSIGSDGEVFRTASVETHT